MPVSLTENYLLKLELFDHSVGTYDVRTLDKFSSRMSVLAFEKPSVTE